MPPAHFLSNVRIKQGVALLLIYLYNISPWLHIMTKSYNPIKTNV